MQKRLLIGAIVTFLALAATAARTQAPEGSKPASTNVLNAQFPSVSPDGRVTFQVKAPGVQKVQIRPRPGDQDVGKNGLGNDPYDMTKDNDGLWTVTIPPAVPGFHYYSLLIDGVAVNDPSSETFFADNKEVSGVDVPEPGVDFYLPKSVPHGQVRILWYESKITGQLRRVLIYTPPDYDDHPQQRYPVLYLRHGASEDETGWIKQGSANFIMDNLIAAGKAKSMLLVMENGTASLPGVSSNAPAGQGPGRPQPGARDAAAMKAMAARDAVAAREAVEELIPEIDSHFRTIADREHRAMAGLSMGAGQTQLIGLHNLDKFSALGMFSPPPTHGVFDLATAIDGAMADTATLNKNLHVFWWGVGGAEPANYETMQERRAAFDKAGIKYVYAEYPGFSHEWGIWRKDLYAFAPLLFRW